MTSKVISPPLDPIVVVKLESDICEVKYPMIITDHFVLLSIQHRQHAFVIIQMGN